MLNKIKIGPKLIGGFLIVAALTLFVGFMGINASGKINGMLNSLYEKDLLGISFAKEANINLIYIGRAVRQLIICESKEERQKYIDNIERYNTQFEALMDSAGKTIVKEEVKQKHREAVTAYQSFYKEVATFCSVMKQSEILKVDASIVEAIKNVRENADKADALLTQFSQMKEGNGKESYDLSDVVYAQTRTLLLVIAIVATLVGLLIGFFLSRSISQPIGQTVQLLTEIADGKIDRKLSLAREDEVGILAKSMDSMVDTLKDLIVDDGGVTLQAAVAKDLTKRLKKDYKGQFLRMKDNINAVIESLDNALQQVAQGTEQVSSASQQISAGSQSLAQGANEQASSLEEVSSSLEEMSSMTKQNAENANQAKTLAGEANGNATQGKQAMARMSDAINKIKESSDQTAKIVKTIDEIAMQTNLLALNAAVEAARAGEAGRGFAVVAEEVRNLAQRSAEAAKNTANMIEESVKNAEEGVTIASDVAKSFEAIAGSNAKVDSLIAEIAAASQEQSQGIDQVNTAVAQMDKVTQQNAANSEESASAAEELSSQAEELQNMVAQFTLTVTGQKAVAKPVTNHPTVAARQARPEVEHKVDLHRKGGNGHSGRSSRSSLVHQAGKEANPRQVIPLEEDVALKEF